MTRAGRAASNISGPDAYIHINQLLNLDGAILVRCWRFFESLKAVRLRWSGAGAWRSASLNPHMSRARGGPRLRACGRPYSKSDACVPFIVCPETELPSPTNGAGVYILRGGTGAGSWPAGWGSWVGKLGTLVESTG